MTPETTAALIAKLQDGSVELQYKGKFDGLWKDSSQTADEIMYSIVEGIEYRIKPSTVSLPEVELPKNTSFFMTSDFDCKLDIGIYFKNNADKIEWADYLNSILGEIK